MTDASQQQPRSFLSRAFAYAKGMHPVNKVLLVAAVSLHIVPTEVVTTVLTPVIDFYRDQSALKISHLSTGEAALVRAVFGDSVDANKIRKRYSSNETACGETNSDETVFVACVRRSSPTITFAASSDFMDDYSRDGSISGSRTTTFMHEATHIWQHRTDAPNSGQCDSYDLQPADVMNTAMTFDDYCSERQAQLVGVYAAFYLRPSQLGQTDLTTEGGRYFDRIRQIVEAKFPRAATVRAQMQSRAASHLTCFNAAANENGKNVCNARFYTNLQGQPLTTAPEQVTFTLPNGQVRYPAIEAARRAGQLPAARPNS